MDEKKTTTTEEEMQQPRTEEETGPVAEKDEEDDTRNPPTNMVTVSTEEYELLHQLKKERRQNILKDKAKLHSKILSSRRITVALRRTDLKSVAPDQDVVAYIEICNLKAVAGDKSEATEDEIAAYLQVFYAGTDQPTLAQIKSACK